MDELVDLWERPMAEEIYMIAGWHQWADAGSISSGLPQHLIDETGAEKIGEITPHGFYMFQIPGTHHLLRPVLKLNDGYRESLTFPQNEIYYWGNDERGLVIFLGHEPHISVDRYAEAFFNMAQMLNVKRVAAVGGVYGAMPYDKERDVSCTYSLRSMKAELDQYAVRFSNYEGGATIGSYLLDRAEEEEIEYLTFNAFVPAYDLSQISSQLQGIQIENDFKAWYDLMRRFNHMFGLGIDLSGLSQQSEELAASMKTKIEELSRRVSSFNVPEFMDRLNEDFTERTFMPLSDVWEEGLGDLLDDLGND
jgi:predicted ATP-grasp superfamily ATP-dependent carboligase